MCGHWTMSKVWTCPHWVIDSCCGQSGSPGRILLTPSANGNRRISDRKSWEVYSLGPIRHVCNRSAIGLQTVCKRLTLTDSSCEPDIPTSFRPSASHLLVLSDLGRSTALSVMVPKEVPRTTFRGVWINPWPLGKILSAIIGPVPSKGRGPLGGQTPRGRGSALWV